MSDEVLPEAKTSILKRPVPWGVCLMGMAYLALLVTWLGSLGRHHWLLDLTSHFRLQYVVACVVIAALAALLRQRLLCAAAVFSFAWNFTLVMDVHQTADAALAADAPLTVLVFNVMGTNDNHVAAIEHVLKMDADIVCLPEVREDWRLDLEPLRVKYPYRVEELGDGDFGIACYTRLPLKSCETRRFAPWRLPTILMTLDNRGTPLTFIGTHPMPPLTGERAAGWKAQLEQIGALVAGIQGEVILGGDLNATPWCEGMRLLRQRSGLGFHTAVPVWPPTWGRHLPVMIPIDHVLIKGSYIVRRREIGPPLGSDHRSVLVEMAKHGSLY